MNLDDPWTAAQNHRDKKINRIMSSWRRWPWCWSFWSICFSFAWWRGNGMERVEPRGHEQKNRSEQDQSFRSVLLLVVGNHLQELHKPRPRTPGVKPWKALEGWPFSSYKMVSFSVPKWFCRGQSSIQTNTNPTYNLWLKHHANVWPPFPERSQREAERMLLLNCVGRMNWGTSAINHPNSSCSVGEPCVHERYRLSFTILQV